MCRATVCIDVGSVRLVIDHISFCAECIEHALCDCRRTSVRTVQTNFDVLEVAGRDRDQITDVTVSSGSKVNRASDIFSGSQRKFFYLSVQICFDSLFYLCLDLLSVFVEKFDSVIIERIMACRDHDTAVKVFCAYCIGNAWGCCYMKKIRVCTGCSQSCNKCILKHVTASSGIFTDHDLCFVISSIIPSYITSNFKRMIHCQFYICLSTKSICSKIFSHNSSPLFVTRNIVTIFAAPCPQSPKSVLSEEIFICKVPSDIHPYL